MKVTIRGETFDPEDAEVMAYAEECDLCHYPKGFRFQRVLLRQYKDIYFLHGCGYLGCHTILPLSDKEKTWWLKQKKQQEKK